MAEEHLKLISRAQKATGSRMDSDAFTKAQAKEWKRPTFQRPLQLTATMRDVIDEINETEVIPGILTFGILFGVKYLLDGQHRVHAFLESKVEMAYAEVRIIEFENAGDMANEYRKINKKIANLKPDDDLRALEQSSTSLQAIHKALPWVGYSHIRANDKGPILSMATLLRIWAGSAADTPVPFSSAGGKGRASVADIVIAMNDAERDQLIDFARICFAAWNRDVGHARLYSALNLGLCAWLYRRTVINPYSSQSIRLDNDTFKKCLMSLAASGDYVDGLLGRTLRDRDRPVTYRQLKGIFAGRVHEELGVARPRFPQPEWAA